MSIMASKRILLLVALLVTSAESMRERVSVDEGYEQKMLALLHEQDEGGEVQRRVNTSCIDCGDGQSQSGQLKAMFVTPRGTRVVKHRPARHISQRRKQVRGASVSLMALKGKVYAPPAEWEDEDIKKFEESLKGVYYVPESDDDDDEEEEDEKGGDGDDKEKEEEAQEPLMEFSCDKKIEHDCSKEKFDAKALQEGTVFEVVQADVNRSETGKYRAEIQFHNEEGEMQHGWITLAEVDNEKAMDDQELAAVPVWAMTPSDKLWLQAGWLVMFIGFVVTAAVYFKIGNMITYAPEKKAADSNAAKVAEEFSIVAESPGIMYNLLWGSQPNARMLNALTIELSVLNFYCFSVFTETLRDENYQFLGIIGNGRDVNKYVEVSSVIFFSVVFVARLMAIHTHPDWKHYGMATAWLRYLLSNIFMLLEAIAICSTLWDLQSWLTTGKYNHLNMLWLFFARAMEMLASGGAGVGFKSLNSMITDKGKLLAVSFIWGGVIWIVMGGLYFCANFENTEETAFWPAAAAKNAKGEWIQWKKFESIPSSMWFVLINLVKEHPLADAHVTFFQRVLVVIACIFAMPLFALPASILQYALTEKEDIEDDEEDDVQSVEEEEAITYPWLYYFWGLTTLALVLTSITAFFFYTARHTIHNTVFGLKVDVDPKHLAIVDGVVAIVFAQEWMYYVMTEGVSYAFSVFSFIDFMAFAPGLVHLSLMDAGEINEWMCAACVLRIFKIERYLHSFRDIIRVTVANRLILTATFLFSMFLWMLFSTLLYATDYNNPDEEIVEQYGSNMRSLWAEIINLHGEWPWADYTSRGKAVGTVIAVCCIMIFSIPISIFGEGFRALLDKERGSVDKNFDRTPWQKRCRPEVALSSQEEERLQLANLGPSAAAAPGENTTIETGGGEATGFLALRQRIYDLLYAHLHLRPGQKLPLDFQLMRGVSFALVILTTGVTLIGSLHEDNGYTGQYHDLLVNKIGLGIDAIACLFFTAEFVMRLLATGWRHPLSVVGIFDMVSLFAFVMTTCFPEVRKTGFQPDYKMDGPLYDDIMVPLRLLRLFSVESYLGALHVMKNVVYLNRWPLARAFGALVSVWFVHATLLYLFERPQAIGEKPVYAGAQCEKDPQKEGPEIQDMHQRYNSVLLALQYSIVHLFGDYPESDYNLQSKAVHFVGIMGGIAIISTFTGVFSASFVDYVKEDRAEDLKEYQTRQLMAATKVGAQLRRLARKKKEAGTFALAKDRAPQQEASALKKFAKSVVLRNGFGAYVFLFFQITLLLNLVNTMIASLPEVQTYTRSWMEQTLLAHEMVATIIFAIEYALRLIANPERKFKFWRMVDLVCLFPGIVLCCVGLSATRTWWGLPIIRAVRILNFPFFEREVVMIGRALKTSSSLLTTPAYLALNVWITTSSLFMWLENRYKCEGGTAEAMSSVPAAMYWCSIFLIGEWANVDFTYAASRLCIFYVIFGIAMFSMPVGIIVEAVQSTIKLVAQEEKDMDALINNAMDHRATLAAVVTRKSIAVRKATIASEREAAGVDSTPSGA